jgi:cytochrome b involved in lipid metabolism
VHAAAVFAWLDTQAFVIEHFGGSTWIIGLDDTTEAYSVLYHDERGVSRVYQMSLRNGLWKLWRNTPDFSQRLKGSLVRMARPSRPAGRNPPTAHPGTMISL